MSQQTAFEARQASDCDTCWSVEVITLNSTCGMADVGSNIRWNCVQSVPSDKTSLQYLQVLGLRLLVGVDQMLSGLVVLLVQSGPWMRGRVDLFQHAD